jgi:hypothetical protein
MIKHNHLAKFIQNIKLFINRLITKKLNKFNIDLFLKEKFNKLEALNLSKIKENYKFNLSILAIIVLFLSYLSFPISYNETELRNKLNNQLKKRLNYSINLPKDFNYSFFPSPHFIYKNFTISDDQNEISQIGELKIFITPKNLFSIKNFDIHNLIIEKSNFYLNNQTYNFFTNLLDTDLVLSEIIIKDSNIFYKNKEDDVLFINKIIDMEYFYDDRNLQNKLISKNEIFNLPYSIELYKRNIEKKFYSKLSLDFLKINIENEIEFSKETNKGLMRFTLNRDKFRTIYSVSKNDLTFNLSDDVENSKISYEGKIDFKPFYLNLESDLKKINILYLINSNNLIPQFLKTEIFNNKNLNVNLRLLGDTFKNFDNFTEINLNSKIQEGLIDIDNTKFTWRNNIDFSLMDSLIYSKQGELILDSKLNININDINEVYKFLLTPKNYRNELSNIKANLVYNFDQNTLNLNDILIDNKNIPELNKILQSLIFKNNKLQNRVYLKSILNKALKSYAG